MSFQDRASPFGQRRFLGCWRCMAWRKEQIFRFANGRCYLEMPGPEMYPVCRAGHSSSKGDPESRIGRQKIKRDTLERG